MGKDHPDTIQILKQMRLAEKNALSSNTSKKKKARRSGPQNYQLVMTTVDFADTLPSTSSKKKETLFEPSPSPLGEGKRVTFFNPIDSGSEIDNFCSWYETLGATDRVGSSSDFRLFLLDLIALIKSIQEKSEYNIDSEHNPELCQYTKLLTLKSLVRADSEEAPITIPKFRISNVAYLNDPSEGQVFIELLDRFTDSHIFSDFFGITVGSREQHLAEIHLNAVYIGSFSTEKNKLPLWSLYGDDSKGCCVVFDNSFFANTRNQVALTNSKEYEQLIKLYRVKYISIQEVNPDGDDILLALKDIAKSIEKWKKVIALNASLMKWLIDKLDEIRFLFKCDDYKYEDEVRLILRDDAANRPFVDRTTEVPKLFINVNNPVVFKEVILGAKVDNPEAPAQFLLFSGVKKVTISGITYR